MVELLISSIYLVDGPLHGLMNGCPSQIGRNGIKSARADDEDSVLLGLLRVLQLHRLQELWLTLTDKNSSTLKQCIRNDLNLEK